MQALYILYSETLIPYFCSYIATTEYTHIQQQYSHDTSANVSACEQQEKSIKIYFSSLFHAVFHQSIIFHIFNSL